MNDNRSHPLLEQVPLTVSPFVNLPTATTLPYTYKTMPSSLPPSASGITSTSSDQKPKYVVSPTGHAAHPDDIVASCRALQAHISKLQAEAEAEIKAFDERVRARDLAERRRLAPGWLDSDVRVLEPERKTATTPVGGGGVGRGPEMAEQMDGGGMEGVSSGAAGQGSGQGGHGRDGASEMAVPDEGEQLDRAFGALGLGRS